MKIHSENYHQPFPKRLRQLMDEYGVNQQELADFVGVKRQTIAQWKDGKTTPDIYNFQKIKAFFKLPYDYLLGETESKQPKNQLVMERLGLSDDAIGMLQIVRSNNESKEKTSAERYASQSEILSGILENPSFLALLEYIQNSMWMLRCAKDRQENLSVEEAERLEKLLRQSGKTVLKLEETGDFYLDMVARIFRQMV